MLKKIILTALLVLVLPVSALAANIQSGDSLSITEQLKNAYLFGSTVNIKADTNGDLTVFGNDVFVDGRVERSMIAGGANVRINAPVEQNAKVFAGNANVDSRVGEDLIVFAGELTTSKNSYISDDLVVCGGSVTLNGNVGKNSKIYASDVTLNGKFSSDVEIHAEKITVTQDTEIKGKLKYFSDQDASISTDAKISEIEYNKENYKFGMGEEDGSQLVGGFFFSLLGLIIMALVVNALFTNFSAKTTNMAYQQSGKSALIGFSYIVLAPIAILLCMISIIGIPLGIGASLIYIASFFISSAFAAILTGKLFMNIIRRPSENIGWGMVVIGSIVFVVLGYIPVLGWFIKLALVIMSMGALVQGVVSRNKPTESGTQTNPKPNIKLAAKTKVNGKSRPKK